MRRLILRLSLLMLRLAACRDWTRCRWRKSEKMPPVVEISVFTSFSRPFAEWMRGITVFAKAVRIGSATLVSSRSLRPISARTVLVSFRGGRILPHRPHSGILAFQPWLKEEGAKGQKGSSENESASEVAPSRGFSGKPEKKTKQNEKDPVNHSREIYGVLVPLNSLHHDRAIEKYEVGEAFKQADGSQSAD